MSNAGTMTMMTMDEQGSVALVVLDIWMHRFGYTCR